VFKNHWQQCAATMSFHLENPATLFIVGSPRDFANSSCEQIEMTY
jgi:hypothetical protein